MAVAQKPAKKETNLQGRFIAKVNAILKERGISRAKLAELMNVQQTVPGRYLNGQNEPGLVMIEKFAKALGVDARELFEDVSDDN